MKNQTKVLVVAGGCIAALALIASCSNRGSDVAYVAPPPQAPVAVAAAPAVIAAPPVVVQAAPAHDGFVTGMLVGHMLNGGGTRVEHHYVNTAPVQRNVVQNVTRNVTVNKTVNTTTNVVRPRISTTPRSNFGSFRSGRR